MLRRKRLPDRLRQPFAAFIAVVQELERGKRSLTEAVPTTRLPGRPLADALSEFEEVLHAAADGMATWLCPELEEAWLAAASGLEEALRRAELLRLEAPDMVGFEGLIGTIGDLMAPLEAFEGAAERFRALRRAWALSPARRR